MTRYLISLYGQRGKAEAHRLIEAAPKGTRVEFKAEKRTIPQNDKMWAMLTDIALQLPWGGKRQPTGKWKRLFLDNLRHELDEDPDLLPSLYDEALRVDVSDSSSDLSKDEMSMLIELMLKFGAAHSVRFGDDSGTDPELLGRQEEHA